MKCKSCEAQVPPNFIAAIADNRCPACGKQLLSDNAYKNIFKVKKQISDLGFDDSILLGIAAALASKFTLVPKSLSLETDGDTEPEVQIEDDDEDFEDVDVSRHQSKPMTSRRIPNVKGMSPKTAMRIQQAGKKSPMEEAEELADVSPEEEAALRSEWGLDVAPKDNVPVRFPSSSDNQFVDMFANMDGLGGLDPDMPAPLGGSGGQAVDAKHAALLAKAQALREDPSKFKVRRVDP